MTVTQAARRVSGRGGVSGAGDRGRELEGSSSLAAQAILQNKTHSPCSPLVFRRRWNVLAGLSVQIHSKLIFVSSMENLGQDLHCLPFS